jgi:predicted enzyme related to lactoylglutathione lyase
VNKGLRTAIYTVSDLTRSKEFYTTLFEEKPYFDEPFYVGYSVGGYELGLVPAEATSPSGLGGVVAYWSVDDIQQAYHRAVELGATGLEAPKNVGGEIWVATVADPDGNPIGYIVNPDFKLPD